MKEVCKENEKERGISWNAKNIEHLENDKEWIIFGR